MSRFAHLIQPDQGQDARTISLVSKTGFEAWMKSLPERERTAALVGGFKGKPGDVVILHGDKPGEWNVALGIGDTRTVWDLAPAAQKLPAGIYRLAGGSAGSGGLGWLLAQYRYDRFLTGNEPVGDRILLVSEPGLIVDQIRQAEATAIVRDLVNTPAADLGPAGIQTAVEALGTEFEAKVHVTKGHELEVGYPMVHAVGQAAEKHRAPRLIELTWGNPKNPAIALIGKGVAFDTGGLNVKTGSFMRLMKKDMGGAAHAIAVARLVMEARLPVHLHLVVPAVENAISGNALRPGDVLKSRKGLTVEIDNTDAEGRLILGDAFTKAAEAKPELMIDFATLTGAARVALGPDLPAMFANDEALATDVTSAANDVQDPLWRMPLWDRYDEMLKSDIADMVNSAEGGMAGAVTAALFLRRFVPEATPWLHFDTFAWRPSSTPGRPKGGDAMGARAVFELLRRRYPVA